MGRLFPKDHSLEAPWGSAGGSDLSGDSVGNVGDANGVPPVPTCAPPGSFAPSLGSWEFSFGRRAPNSLLPTHPPPSQPSKPPEEVGGRLVGEV